MSAAGDGKAGLAEELRRRRIALGWTLEQVAVQAQLSVGMPSLIGKRRPSLSSWQRIRQTLGRREIALGHRDQLRNRTAAEIARRAVLDNRACH